MRKVTSQANFQNMAKHREKNSGISKTVPDDSISLRDLLINHTRGKSSNVIVRQPIYDDQITFNDVRELDLVDVQEIKRHNAQEAADYQKNKKQKSKDEISSAQTTSEISTLDVPNAAQRSDSTQTD